MPERILGYAREVHPKVERLRRLYFWAHLGADFGCGLCFVVGSVFFFYDSLMRAGTWLFLVGSLLFAAKPTLRLLHELQRTRLVAALAEAGELAGAEEWPGTQQGPGAGGPGAAPAPAGGARSARGGGRG